MGIVKRKGDGGWSKEGAMNAALGGDEVGPIPCGLVPHDLRRQKVPDAFSGSMCKLFEALVAILTSVT